MRIDSLSIQNFRGIRRVELTGLASEPLITVSGRNGSGKSLLLEAIGLAWRADRLPGGFLPQFLIGPWGTEMRIAVGIHLDEDERGTLERFAQQVGTGLGPAPSELQFGITVVPNQAVVEADPWVHVLRRPDFAQAHAFGQIDHIPADRTLARGEHAQVNPALMHDDQREAFRNNVVGSYAQQRNTVGIQGVAPLLATADYLELLAGREGAEVTSTFEAITDPFFAATGKRIHRPKPEPTSPSGAAMNVELPTGIQHTLDQLSSGEQEVLSLTFFVRRLSARGGVLMIDEPEMHLHPALQRSLFAQLEAVSERAQIWVVTHSPRLITVASLGAVLHMTPAPAEDANQVAKASDEAARLHLLEDLGVHPVEVLQSQFFLVVEGQQDEQRLLNLFPIELSAGVPVVAGNASGVERVTQSLRDTAGIPFLAVRDRDLLSQQQVADLTARYPDLYVWPGRSLETELLHIPLLEKTMERVGKPVRADVFAAKVRELADEQREQILAELVEARLKERHAFARGQGSPLDRLEANLQERARVATAQLNELRDTHTEVERELAERWDADHALLVDAKRALPGVLTLTPFHSVQDLIAAEIATLKEHPELEPPGVAEVRQRLLKVAAEAM